MHAHLQWRGRGRPDIKIEKSARAQICSYSARSDRFSSQIVGQFWANAQRHEIIIAESGQIPTWEQRLAFSRLEQHNITESLGALDIKQDQSQALFNKSGSGISRRQFSETRPFNNGIFSQRARSPNPPLHWEEGTRLARSTTKTFKILSCCRVWSNIFWRKLCKYFQAFKARWTWT